MRPVIDKEILLRVDPRSLSSHRGYVQSMLAPIQVRHDGIPLCTAYGTLLFDHVLLANLADSVAVRMTTGQSVIDLIRSSSPWHPPLEHWRDVTTIRDLLEDVAFAEHVNERLMELGHLRGRRLAAFDAAGHPSGSLLSVLLKVLESLESLRGPEWARLGLEYWTAGTVIPKGYVASESRPPREGHDMFAYCHQVYDIAYAYDILPDFQVRAFTHALLSRSEQRGIDFTDLLDAATGQPSIATLSACAEALARGIVRITQVVPFVKRRVAERQTSRLTASSTMLPPGLLAAVHAAFLEISREDRDFTFEELTEIALQATIHGDNPQRIARIVYAVVSVEEKDAGYVAHGSVLVSSRTARLEGIAI